MSRPRRDTTRPAAAAGARGARPAGPATSDPVSPHGLILASAGTGKTWRLTGRFLALLLRGVPPESILATTFTRKAAGEILDRVLRRLVEAAEDPKKRRELGEQVGDELSEARVRELLATLARGIDRFRVRTLDAFFVQLARLFALDLGLPPDWSIVEEAADDALRRESIARALARADSAELLDLLRGLQQAGATRSVERLLLQRVAECRDAFLDSRTAAWDRIRGPARASEEDLAAARAVIEELEVPLTKTTKKPNANWAKAKTIALDALVHGSWGAFLAGGLGPKVALGETSYDRFPIAGELADALQACLGHAAHVLVGEVAIENRAAHRWLERFEESYEELKGEERAYRFEDLPKALHPRDENRIAARDAVWYRLDGRVDHLLLDEFQDTAPVQWRILEHLASEILADGTGTRSFFCVGDVKQSIYGWREAEPRLLAGMQARYPVLVPERMAESWRSSHVVLKTVDLVFGAIARNPALADEPARQRAAQAWQEDFDTPTWAKDLPGAAFLVEAREREERAVLELAAERASAILDQAPLATIGILLRRNQHIGRLIWLLGNRRIRASGEGGNPLVDSAAVLHMVSLLHLADHPSDRAAAFHVASSPLASAAELTRAGYRDEAEKASASVRRRLGLEGYGAFCASFLDEVAAGYGEWDRKRFAQLVDLAYAFDAHAGLRTAPFLEHVRRTPVEDPSATQVKVMTIHAAKGLEFDAVILPELDQAFALRDSALLTSRPDPAGLLEAVSASRGQAICRLDPAPGGLADLWEERTERETREALCLLYVALTRARYRLDLLVQPPSKSGAGKVSHTFAGILRWALSCAPGAAPPDALWAHPENHAPWFPPALAARATHAPSPVADGALRPEIAFRAPDRPRALPVRTPSAEEGGERKLQPRTLLASPAARVRGKLAHRWLEELEWIEDFDADDATLLALAAAETADGQLAREALADLRKWLSRSEVRAALSRPELAAGERLEVWRERAFSEVLPDAEDAGGAERAGAGGEALWSGVFDRVVLRLAGDAPVAAEVLDYKTDDVRAAELEERARFYRPQLAGYRRVLARMTGLAEECIVTRLLFLRPDRRIDVSHEDVR